MTLSFNVDELAIFLAFCFLCILAVPTALWLLFRPAWYLRLRDRHFARYPRGVRWLEVTISVLAVAALVRTVALPTTPVLRQGSMWELGDPHMARERAADGLPDPVEREQVHGFRAYAGHPWSMITRRVSERWWVHIIGEDFDVTVLEPRPHCRASTRPVVAAVDHNEVRFAYCCGGHYCNHWYQTAAIRDAPGVWPQRLKDYRFTVFWYFVACAIPLWTWRRTKSRQHAFSLFAMWSTYALVSLCAARYTESHPIDLLRGKEYPIEIESGRRAID